MKTINIKAEISRIKFNLARNTRKMVALQNLADSTKRRSATAKAATLGKLALATQRVSVDQQALRVAQALATYLPQVVAHGRPHLRAQGTKLVSKRKSKVA